MRIAFPLFLFITLIHATHSSGATEIKRPGEQLGFTPHKALYAVKLQSARSGSQIINIDGHMYYDWAYDCDAWTSKHRFNVLYEYADSPAMRISSDFSNFEKYDATTLDYSVIRYQDGRQYEGIRGQARSFADQKGEAIYNEPPGLVQSLPAGTLYPMAHTIKVLKAANDGEKFVNATVFDGSDGDGPVEINAFIGKQTERAAIMDVAEDNKALDQSLINGKAREIQLAFFPLNKYEDQADYEMNLTLHDNSVISDMLINYSDFSVSQTLIAIEPTNTTEAAKSCQ